MNAIYGANSKEMFLKLKKLNNKKTKNNNSFLLINDQLLDVYKIHALSKGFRFPKKQYHTFLGVTENKTELFDAEKMNPLLDNKWMICFIGEIKNIEDIVDDDCSDLPSNPLLQNKAILSLLNYVDWQTQSDDDIFVMSEALSLIEGDFSMWAHNTENRNVYLMKCNTNLCADVYHNNFSTMDIEGFEPLNDGEIYQLTKEGITHVGDFDCNLRF